MRSTEDQMKEILRRKDIYTKTKLLKRKIIADISTGLVCLALMAGLAYFLPKINMNQEHAPILRYGSMIQSLPVIGYILVAILAFVMGIAVTMACIHWKERRNKEQEL